MNEMFNGIDKPNNNPLKKREKGDSTTVT